MVSGTPLTPSTSNLYVYLTPEMFAERTQHVDSSCKCLTPDTSGKWNIASKDGSTGAASVSLTCGQNSIEGQAGVTELDTSFTITLKNAIFAKDMEKGTDVSVWFSGIYGQNNLSNNLPVDVAAVLTADVHVSSGGYGKAGQEIDYSDREPVKIYAVDQKTKAVTGGAIVLSGDTPTLETGVDYKCYSTDGGTKWKDASKKKLTEKQFAALVNKGMEFRIADKYDKSAKGPADDANVYEFEKILKQDKAPKLKIDYETCADATGETTGQFILAVQDGKENDSTYAAGETFKVIVKYGVYDENKSGILEAPVYQLIP